LVESFRKSLEGVLTEDQIALLDSIIQERAKQARDQSESQDGTEQDIELAGNSSQLPEAFDLAQNSPNPFNPSTTISYTVPFSEQAAVPVSIMVFDVRGKQVVELVNKVQGPGVYSVLWDGTNASGGRVSSGVYFYRLRAGDYSENRKMVLLK
ncbi:MAG: T9SS type A sorting domain-containing protein, partial [Gemmatimonadota bacterium]|nr:T9SS type A sorting domain-containing protein [Gemmatimonadota bacterium]